MSEHLSNSSPPHPAWVEVSAGLVFRAGKLLITQRRPQDHLGGLWEFPGGKLEAGENARDCLIRELREELGIEIEVGALLKIIEHHYPEKSVRLNFFLCTWLQQEPQAIGCHGYAWVTRNQLAKYVFPAADAQLLQTLLNTPELWRVAKS